MVMVPFSGDRFGFFEEVFGVLFLFFGLRLMMVMNLGIIGGVWYDGMIDV
jgi:hypothetical protein